MIELFNIFLFFFILLLFFSFPFCIYNKKSILFNNSSFNNFYTKISFNILFHINILLLISFFNYLDYYYFYSALVFSIIFNIYYLSKKSERNFELVTFILFFLIVVSIFLKVSIDLKLEWDGLNHWLPKALSFFNGNGLLDLNNLGFSEYPHLGTYIWAFFWKNSYLQYEYFGRFFYIFFYVSSIFCLFEGFFDKNINIKCILIFLFSIITYDLFLFAGYQEYLIFSSLCILSKYFYNNLSLDFGKDNFLKKFFISTLFFQAIIWFKDEAIFYYVIIFSCFLYFTKKLKKEYLLIIVILFFPILQYMLQKFIIGTYGFQAEIIHEELYKNLKIKVLLNKVILISNYILISMIKYKLWLINMFSLFTLLIFYRNEIIRIKPWIYVLVLNIILIFLIYIQTPYDVEFLLKVTLDRIMFQTSGFYFIFTLILLSKIIDLKED